ncbi:MAG: hypothetical protein RLZZ245_1456 [Verrucomicrobiota bacterium]
MKALKKRVLVTLFGLQAITALPAQSQSGPPLPNDTPAAPTVLQIQPSVGLNSISIRFNEPLSDSSANVSNFKITGLTISRADLDAATKTVITLSTSEQTSGVSYTIAISGVKDRTPQANPIADGSTVTFIADAVTNGSFENDLSGWKRSGNVQIISEAPYSATDGQKLAVFNSNQSNPSGVLSQSFTTSVGALYSISFEAGAIGVISQQRLGLEILGKSSLVSETISIAGLGGSSTRWLPKTYGFIANSTSTTLSFTDRSLSGDNIDLVLDNVRLVRQVARTLIVSSTPSVGVGVSLSPSDINGSGSGSTNITRQYISGTIITLTAPLSVGKNSFIKWKRNGKDFTFDRSTSMAMDIDYTMQAVYGPGQELLTNGSFESNFTSWKRKGNVKTVSGTAYATSSGKKLMAFNASNTTPSGVIAQSFSTIPGANYQVKFSMGALAQNTSSQTLRFTLKGKSTLVNKSAAIKGAADGKVRWSTKSFSFVADSYATNLTFADLSTTTSAIDLLLDNVQVIGPAPVTPKFVNGSFETDLTNWSAVGNLAVVSKAPYIGSDGDNLIAFNAGNKIANGTLSRRIITTRDTIYTLMFDVGVLAYNTGSQTMRVEVFGENNLLSQSISITGTGEGIRWLPQQFTFVADGTTATVSFTDISKTTNNIDLLLDNVRLFGSSSNAAPRAVAASAPLRFATNPPLPANLPPLPQSAPSFLRDSAGVRVGLPAAASGRYVLERSSDLITWEFHSEIELTEAGPLDFLDASPPNAQGFYRIARRPEPPEN